MNVCKPVLILFSFVVLQMQEAQGQDLNKTIISIELKNATLTEALQKIESLTSFKFNYKTADLAAFKGITYKQQQVSVKKVLTDLLQHTPLQFEQVQHHILIKQKPAISPYKNKKITITGMVKETGTGEPLPYVNIIVLGLPGGTTTNAAGYFTLHGIPSDSSVLVFSAIGHQQVLYPVSMAGNKEAITIEMNIKSRAMNEITIQHKQSVPFKLNSRPGVVQLSPANLALLPKVGEKDIFRSLQLMPGISAGNEQSAGLYVRGGTPDQNLVLFDGFTVYNVDHLFGFFSTFNVNAIKDVQVHKSGFDAKYGGRLSALADITGKEGNKNHFNAGIDLSAMSANGFIETPIGKKMTALVTYRRSFKTPIYDSLLNHARVGQLGADEKASNNGRLIGTAKPKSYFDDMNAKLTFRPTEKDGISVSFYHGKDHLDNGITNNNPTAKLTVTDISEWGNTGASIKWTHKWSPGFFTSSLLSHSNYFSDRQVLTTLVVRDTVKGDITSVEGFNEHNKLQDYTLKSGFEWTPGPVHSIEGGIQITYNDIAYRYIRNDTTTVLNRNTTGATSSIYLQDQLHLLNNRLAVTPGIRVSHFDPTRAIYYEPRLTATYELTSNIKLKGAAGKYNQFVKRVMREDVLNGSRDFWVLADGNRLPVSGSGQYMAGASWENKNYLLDVETWYKRLKGLTEYTLHYQANLLGAPYEELFFEGRGYARGVDLLLQKKFGKYTGWIAYTLAEVKHNFPVYQAGYFYAANDIRQEFKMVQSFHHKRWDFTLTWLYLTGKPYTAPAGGFRITMPSFMPRSYIVATDKNLVRQPAYHRLDAAVNWNYGKPGKLHGTIGLSVFNAYNNVNIWYKNFVVYHVTTIYKVVETDVHYLGMTPNLNITCKLR